MSLCRRFLFVAILAMFVGRAHSQDAPLDVLVKHLQSKNKAHRLEAMKQLGRLGTAAKEAAPAIGQALRNAESEDEVSRATATLAMIGPAGVPELTPLFKDARIGHARHAAAALAKMGPAGKKADPQLVAVLKDHDPVLRGFAAQALGEIGDFSDEVVFALFGMIADPVPQVRQQAGYAILRAGPKAVPGLKEILSRGEGAVRVEAANLLGMMGTDALAAKSDLISGLGDPDPEMRGASASALGAMKGKAPDAIPELLNVVNREKNYFVQHEMFQAINQIGDEDVPGLLDAMRKLNMEGNWAAPFALARFGPRGVDAVRPLIKTLKDANGGMRAAAATALGQIGPDAALALPHLQLLLKDPMPQVRFAAAEAITKVDLLQKAAAFHQFQQRIGQLYKEFGFLRGNLDKALLDMRQEFGAKTDQKVFHEPRIQKQLYQIVDIQLAVSAAMTNSRGRKDPAHAQLAVVSMQASAAIKGMGPEGIPALVYGINQASAFQLGFC